MLLADQRMGKRQRKLIEHKSNRIFVSAVTVFEIATKVRIGKLPEAAELSRDFELVCQQFDYQQLGVSHAHARRAGELGGPHRDPFDRLLAGQSLAEGMPLVSSDPAFQGFGVETIW